MRKSSAATKKVRRRAKATAPTSCSLKANIGRRARGVPGSGPYHVCLTATQKKALFGDTQPKKSIGCGTFACVWPGARADRVVKLTRDRDDVEGLRAAQGLDRVVKVFEIRELVNAGRDARTGKHVPVYAVVAERLKPLTRQEQRELEKPLERARMVMLKLAKRHRGDKSTFQAPAGAEQAKIIGRVCANRGKGCERFAESFLDGWAAMFRRGVLWQDAHTGNIAMDSQRRWRAIDLGFSGTKKRSDIAALNGPRW
jgi:hypothetical protein